MTRITNLLEENIRHTIYSIILEGNLFCSRSVGRYFPKRNFKFDLNIYLASVHTQTIAHPRLPHRTKRALD